MDNTLSMETQQPQSEVISQPVTFTRFDLSQRIEHLVFLTAFSLLAITGLAQAHWQAFLAAWPG